MGYKKDTIKGLSWMTLLRGSMRSITFVKIAFLARLLAPAQYGLFGIAGIVLAFLEILTETGINVFFIQREGELKDYINTAWVVSIIRGILISILIIIGAPYISAFFKSPEAKSLIQVIALVPLIRGFINPAIIQFRKELYFKKEFIFRLVVFAVDGVVAITLAFLLRSPVSLVWGMIAGGTLEVILSFILVRPLPRFVLDLSHTKKVIGRGKWVTAAGIFNYLFQQGDDIVVGRLLDTSSLGLYQMIYKISTLPITEVSEVFGSVTFPIYSRIANDKKRLKEAFYKITLVISVIAIFSGSVLILFPEMIIRILLGNQWLEGAKLLQVITLFGVLYAVISSTSALFLAVKKQEYVTGVTLVSILGMALSILPLISRYGLIGAGLSPLVGSVLALPLVCYYLWKVFYDHKL